MRIIIRMIKTTTVTDDDDDDDDGDDDDDDGDDDVDENECFIYHGKLPVINFKNLFQL